MLRNPPISEGSIADSCPSWLEHWQVPRVEWDGPLSSVEPSTNVGGAPGLNIFPGLPGASP